ncbi:MAG: hypothetical protein PHF33_01265 [Candidatus Delongbacteria bacterium]|nr:hypothetical protein [Candidatus Delongbacteria bacterium]MDD4205334.1 hypothetical protein [Candidatus Delongbacteria bacterium]
MSWDFREHIVVSPKLSLGVIGNQPANMLFRNITIGMKKPYGHNKEEVFLSYYLEVQGGWIGIPDPGGFLNDIDPITVYGGGIGFSLSRNKENYYLCPKFSAFAGLIGFAIVDADYNTLSGWNSDVGLQLALPFFWIGDAPSL